MVTFSPGWRMVASPLRSQGRTVMPTFISLASWTEDGVKNAKESPGRLDQARAMGKKMGVNIREFFMTTGTSDMLIIAEASDDTAMAKFNLSLAMGGNVRTTTLKAFSEDEYRKIIAAL